MNHRTLTPVVALLAACLSACAPLPQRAAPSTQIALPTHWSHAQSEADADATPLAANWWTQLGDAELNTLVQQALQHNTDVLAAAARVQEAQATLASTDAARSPQVNATLGAQSGRSLTVLGPSHSRSLQPGVQASWELDLWGRLAQHSAAADARVQASRADQAAVRLSVASATVQAYIALRALQAQLAISEATAVARERALQLASDQLRVGYSAPLQHTQAQAEYEQVQQQVLQLQWQIDQQRNALQVLLGQTQGFALHHTDGAAALQALQWLPMPASLPSQLLERRPDIARASHVLAASDHQLAAQRAAFLPQVNLSASMGSLLVNALDYNPLTVWSLGGSLLAPLFNAGKLQAQVDVASAQRDQAAYAHRSVVLNAFAEVDNAWSGSQRLAQQLQHAEQRREVLQQSLGYAHDRYTAGYASYLEELDAQRNLYAAQLEVVRLRQAVLQQRVQLYKALGGGWQSPAAAPQG